MTVELGTNPSWAWCSLLEGRKVFEKRLIWKVGNGQNIRVYEDNWLPGEYLFAMPSEVLKDPNIFMVHQLKLSSGEWNEQLL